MDTAVSPPAAPPIAEHNVSQETGPLAELDALRGGPVTSLQRLLWARSHLARLQAYRASLRPAQLAAQAKLGAGEYQLARDDEAVVRPLVKASTRFGWDREDPGRIQLMVISWIHNQPYMEAGLRSTFETLDYERLHGLLR